MQVQTPQYAKYLGIYLHADCNVYKEIRKRISATSIMWQKLRPYWLNSNSSIKEKVLVYNAVIRAKLMYGLETAQLNAAHKHSLDVFQRKLFRKMVGHRPYAHETKGEFMIRTNARLYIFAPFYSGKAGVAFSVL